MLAAPLTSRAPYWKLTILNALQPGSPLLGIVAQVRGCCQKLREPRIVEPVDENGQI
jgi:hypothetical protein